jgi:hypothetical protein
MKKIILILTAISLFTVSCKQEYENWYSETYEFDGMFNVSNTCEASKVYDVGDVNRICYDGYQALTYNTSANVQKEIWLETRFMLIKTLGLKFKKALNYPVTVKAKFQISGDPSQFSGVNKEAENINKDFFIYGSRGLLNLKHDSIDKPTSVGETAKGLQICARMTLVEGKITPGVTTIGDNVSDGFSLKTIMHHNNVAYVSAEMPKEKWKNSDVPEYEWTVESSTPIPAADGWDETWTFDGYRHTGFPEDQY